jgi:hypothetical protein
MDNSSLCNALKKLAQQYAFSNSSVLRMEALGASALDGLLTFYWNAISSRESFDDLLSKRGTAVNKYVFALVSQPKLFGGCNSFGRTRWRGLLNQISGIATANRYDFRHDGYICDQTLGRFERAEINVGRNQSQARQTAY